MIRFTLRTKLTLLFLGFGALPLAVAGPVAMNSLDQLRQEKLNGMQASADSVNELIDRNLFERYGDVQAFGVNHATTNTANWYKGAESPLVQVMNKYVTGYGFYKMTLLVDLSGRVAAVNSVDNQGKTIESNPIYQKNFKDASWFVKAIGKQFLKGEGVNGTVVEQPHYDENVSETYHGEDGFVLTFAAPVYDETGKTIAVWANFADFGLVEDIIKSQYEHLKSVGVKNMAFAIQDSEGTALVNYDPVGRPDAIKRVSSVIGHKPLTSLEIPAAAASLKSPSGTSVEFEEADNDYDAVGWGKSDGALGYPGLGWTAIMHEPASETFADVIAAKHKLLVLGLGALVVVMALGLTVGIFFSRPIRRLSKVAEKLAEGDCSEEIIGMKRGDELGDMARAMMGLRSSVEKNSEFVNLIKAMGRSQAVIEFSLDGTILDANENFLSAMGYSLAEIKGKHHSMFVDTAMRNSAEYTQLWDALNRGQYQAQEFPRVAKGGKLVWIQASYNPIMDMNGKPFKVVKFATDITKQKQAIAEINDVISAATGGNLTTRIDTSQFDGFYGEMTRSMNGLMDAVAMPVDEAVEILTYLSNGDLTHRMEGEYAGTFGEIRTSLDATISKLREMVRQIVDTAQSVKSAASEIATGSSDLSMRTEQQASSLEETAASMEELTGTVRKNAQDANNANDLSTRASEIADAGGKVVTEAVGAMGTIEKSSQKISDIIGVIDEIAFQTNLLALNAAVEAARAGDAGKGFAVVASEVRALAGRSASASKEIKALINESAGQVKTGAELVHQAGDTLKNIVGSVRQVAGIVSDIASASAQQATGIDEINSAVTQMDEVTQQNAALVEENTAAAHSMLEQAKQLEALIAFFRVDDSGASAPVHVAPRPAPVAAKPAAKAPAAKTIKVNGRAVSLPASPNGTSHAAHEQGWEEF